MIALFSVIFFVLIVLALTFLAITRASPGYEDAAGFHYGERAVPKQSPRSRSKRRRASK
jgi:hypothetical protein